MWKVSKNPVIRNPRVLVMAHRGDSGHFPENTIQSFEDAYNSGVDCIETDVHLTKDNQFIFFHDDAVDRTTNGHGLVSDFTLDELKKLDAGYNFEATDEQGNATFPFRDKGYKIHAVHEILPMFPKVRFNFDIKDKDPAASELFAELLNSLNVEDRVLVGSFHQKQIKRFRKYAPAISTSAGPKEVFHFWRKAKKGVKRRNSYPNYMDEIQIEPKVFAQRQKEIFGKVLPYVALQIPEGYYFLRLISPDFIHFAHYVGIAIHVWTINDVKTMRKLIHWNIDGIFTDYPIYLLDLIKSEL